ncbi:hypothetical protein [Rhodococcus erythropolis]|uniref:hypothetical protein n=1 Tax=Rhodococcus erythropolis TaxID=1833 RepID=UPI0036717D40
MRQMRPGYGWLPEHQTHVIGTLAHVDRLIDDIGQMLSDYLRPGPFTLDNVLDGDQAHVIVTATAPIPEAIPRYIADCLTQLRAALEHTLYAEVQNSLDQPLTKEEARAIEFPACPTVPAFTEWLKHGRRRKLKPLTDGSELVSRIRQLQPFQRRDPDEHPALVLAEHTNMAKHRAPAVAMTRLGAVVPAVEHPDLTVSIPLRSVVGQDNVGLPINEGDVIASGPRDVHIPLDIWPMVSIQRPHTESWPVVMKELGYLEKWIRTTAIPILINGTRDVPELPPHLDITTGYKDIRSELHRAGTIPAFERDRARWDAVASRGGLLECLKAGSDLPRDSIEQWVDALDDDRAIAHATKLRTAPVYSAEFRAVVSELLAEVRAHASHEL